MEFAGDPRRASTSPSLAPELDVLIGSDDTVLEIALAGKGWISGYTSAFPRSCVELYRASVAGELESALPLHRSLPPLLSRESAERHPAGRDDPLAATPRRGPPRGRGRA
jgi:4-hydroxy-tetrahydrodipicolinate synthase